VGAEAVRETLKPRVTPHQPFAAAFTAPVGIADADQFTRLFQQHEGAGRPAGRAVQAELVQRLFTTLDACFHWRFSASVAAALDFCFPDLNRSHTPH
jgi:hypothetical protein